MAKKFVFKLAPVLDIRSRAVDAAKVALGEAMGRRIAKEEQIDEQEQYIASLTQQPVTLGRSSTQAIEAGWYHLRAARKQLAELLKEYNELLRREDVLRGKLAKAMREEKIILNLEEKQRLEHKQAEEHAERAFLDDLSQQRRNSSFL